MMNFFRNTDGTWGRDILLIAALFLGDMSVRVGFADRVGAICNPSGPWGVEIAGHFLTVSSVVLVIVIIVLLNRAHTEFMRIGLLLILAGGIGNIFDGFHYKVFIADIPVNYAVYVGKNL